MVSALFCLPARKVYSSWVSSDFAFLDFLAFFGFAAFSAFGGKASAITASISAFVFQP